MLLSYPNFSEEFIIHTNDSKTQLRGIITQNRRPVAFFSYKLTPTHTNLYYYRMRTVKYSGNPKIITRHSVRTLYNRIYGPQKITFENFTTERVLHLQLLLREYGPAPLLNI